MISSKENMGLIAVAGIMNMREYWHDRKATEEIMQDGYIYTNDLGYIDTDGSVYMLGRADDVINYKGLCMCSHGGQNVRTSTLSFCCSTGSKYL